MLRIKVLFLIMSALFCNALNSQAEVVRVSIEDISAEDEKIAADKATNEKAKVEERNAWKRNLKSLEQSPPKKLDKPSLVAVNDGGLKILIKNFRKIENDVKKQCDWYMKSFQEYNDIAACASTNILASPGMINNPIRCQSALGSYKSSFDSAAANFPGGFSPSTCTGQYQYADGAARFASRGLIVEADLLREGSNWKIILSPSNTKYPLTATVQRGPNQITVTKSAANNMPVVIGLELSGIKYSPPEAKYLIPVGGGKTFSIGRNALLSFATSKTCNEAGCDDFYTMLKKLIDDDDYTNSFYNDLRKYSAKGSTK